MTALQSVPPALLRLGPGGSFVAEYVPSSVSPTALHRTAGAVTEAQAAARGAVDGASAALVASVLLAERLLRAQRDRLAAIFLQPPASGAGAGGGAAAGLRLVPIATRPLTPAAPFGARWRSAPGSIPRRLGAAGGFRP